MNIFVVNETTGALNLGWQVYRASDGLFWSPGLKKFEANPPDSIMALTRPQGTLIVGQLYPQLYGFDNNIPPRPINDNYVANVIDTITNTIVGSPTLSDADNNIDTFAVFRVIK